MTPKGVKKIDPVKDNDKIKDLEKNKIDNKKKAFTTNKGLKMAEEEFSLKAGRRGPTLLEDFHLREKIMHFDHERIPERIVHARGVGAHGIFKCTKDMSKYTKACLFTKKGKETPLFSRISTVAGSRGSTDTPRDVRGFAIKFYTEEGNYDIAGNNMPVFVIQDAMKFPDFVHAVKSDVDRGFDPSGLKAKKEALKVRMPEFSQENTIFKVDTLKVGIYSDDDDDFDFKSLVKKIEDKKAKAEIIQANLSETKDGQMVSHRYDTIHPVLEDAMIVVVPKKPSKEFSKNVNEFVNETFNHYKPLWIIGDVSDILDKNQEKADGVMVTKDAKDISKFIENLGKQRFWNREGSI